MADWVPRFIEMAKLVATWSKDPSTRVGAVIADQKNRIVSTGFNGFPHGVKDEAHRLADREWKYPATIHAEHNAILFADRDLTGCTLYVTHHPCPRCMAVVAQVGIKRVFYCEELDAQRWGDEVEISKEIAKDTGIHITRMTAD